ncbi:MAG: hypothetical protein NTX05_08670 [Fusobacteria bacterium]|nr:hypothetical protein [Fusobacteriota bacterium]
MKKQILLGSIAILALSAFSFADNVSGASSISGSSVLYSSDTNSSGSTQISGNSNITIIPLPQPTAKPIKLILNTYAGINAPLASANGSFKNNVLNQSYSQSANGVFGGEIMTPISPVDQIGFGMAYYTSVQLANAIYPSYYNGLPVYLAYKYYFPLFGNGYVPYVEMRGGYNFVVGTGNSNINLIGGLYATFGIGMQVFDWTFQMDYLDTNAGGNINGQSGTLNTQGLQFTVGKLFNL